MRVNGFMLDKPVPLVRVLLEYSTLVCRDIDFHSPTPGAPPCNGTTPYKRPTSTTLVCGVVFE